MVKIIKMEEITSIKAGVGSTILSDGTIRNPESYIAINIKFEDDRIIQIKRPLTTQKIKSELAKQPPKLTFDGISEGQDIV